MLRQSKILFMFIVIGLSLAAGPFLPLVLKSFFYALSLSIKSCILFLLPFIIFGLLFKVMVPQNTLELTPLWSFTLPKLITNKAMLLALGLGVVYLNRYYSYPFYLGGSLAFV